MNKLIGKFGKRKVIIVGIVSVIIIIFVVVDLATVSEKEFIRKCRNNKNVLGEEMILNMMKDRYDETEEGIEKHQVALKTIYKEELEDAKELQEYNTAKKKEELESVSVSMFAGLDTSIKSMDIQTIVSNKNERTVKAIYFDIVYMSYGNGEIGRVNKVYKGNVKTNGYLETSYKITLPDGWDYVNVEITDVEF